MEDEDRNWGFSCELYVDVYLFITVVLTQPCPFLLSSLSSLTINKNTDHIYGYEV